jgi:hypothetical protein
MSEIKYVRQHIIQYVIIIVIYGFESVSLLFFGESSLFFQSLLLPLSFQKLSPI